MESDYKDPIDLYVDGSSRGNPGPSAIGIVAYVHDSHEEPVYELSKYIGTATNNIAEYEALIHALKWLVHTNLQSATIHLDSELVYKQIIGTYRVKNPRMVVQLKRVMRLVEQIKQVSFILIPREENKTANHLAQKASKTITKPNRKFDQGKLL